MPDVLASLYWINIITNIILVISSLLLVILFTIREFKHSKIQDGCNCVRILPYAVFIMGFIWFLTLLIMSTFPILFNFYTSPTQTCDLEVKIRTWIVAVFIHTLFLNWYSRLKCTFNESAFRLTPCQHGMALSSIFISFLFFTFTTAVMLQGEVYPVKITLGNPFWDQSPYNGYSFLCRPLNTNLKLQMNTFIASIVTVLANVIFASAFISKLRQVANLRQHTVESSARHRLSYSASISACPSSPVLYIFLLF